MAKAFTNRSGRKAAVTAAQQETNLDQVAHEKQMASQTPQQRTAMIKGLAALARSKLTDPQHGDADAKRT